MRTLPKALKVVVVPVILALVFFIPSQTIHAAPPIFDSIGEERDLNSNLYVIEGNQIEFTVSAQDPEGDTLIYSAENVPSWATFDPGTRTFSGTAPLWTSDYNTRLNQQGIFDITFRVTDGTYTVAKIITINILDASWTPQTMAELVASRPISAGIVGTPVTLTNVVSETIWTDYGGGKNIRRITFGFTSQVPDLPGWGLENDWVVTTNYAYLPLDPPPVNNAGAVVEGAYAMDWGRAEMGERACAELNIPVVVIDRSWLQPTDVPDPHVYTDMAAVNFRDPKYLWAAFSSAHFLRATDALVTIIDTTTDWPVSYSDFRVVVTGLSKFGYSAWTTAAADPQRVFGLMSAGWELTDYDAYRLLAREQGGLPMTAGSSTYLGLIMKYYAEPLGNLNEMNPDTQALLSGTTNDMRGTAGSYMSKYAITASEKQLTIPRRVGYVPNLGHTTISDQHSTYWRMWLAHTFLERPLSSIDKVRHYPDGSNIAVEATVSGTPVIQEVRIWATNQSDKDTSAWDGFTSYPMSIDGDIYKGQIPGNSTVYYVEVLDTADGVEGIISSPPKPVDNDYPLLRLPPENVEDFQAVFDSQNSEIDLTWINPLDEDFAGVTIFYKSTGYPARPMDGIQVCDGVSTACNHTGVNAGRYYYAAFTYDSQGNYNASTRIATVCADCQSVYLPLIIK